MVRDRHFDAVIVGAGPAGSMAALVLAGAGHEVALVDKASFPRDKACGDLVGPRGVAILEEHGLGFDECTELGDMAVVGPGGGRVLLPAVGGRTYPGTAWAVPRMVLDHRLRQAALAAGAVAIHSRVTAVETSGVARGSGTGRSGSPVVRVALDDGRVLGARVAIGADGATSVVARSAGLLQPGRARWGFAIRGYLAAEIDVPTIFLFDEPQRRGFSTAGRGFSGYGWLFPGYGWLFPGTRGSVNLGVGVGVGADRKGGALATRSFPGFLDRLGEAGLVDPGAAPGAELGGWLRMGMAGTRPAEGAVLLTGDAAGLVNPLQGEGISQALGSGVAAARAVLEHGDRAAVAYRAWLRREHAAYQLPAGTIQGAMLDHPRLASAIARALTWPPVGARLAPGWALYWNDLVRGSAPVSGRTTARVAAGTARLLSGASAVRRHLRRELQ